MKWLIYALLSALSAALVAIFGKVGVRDIDSNVATAVRAVIMAILMVIVTIAQGTFGKITTIPKVPMLFIFLSGLAGALSWIFYFRALQVGKASQVAPIDRLSVVFAVLLAALFLKEKINAQLALGVGLMVVGAILVSLT